MAELKDSGNRKEFPTGAVRDARPGVGRCDLLPLEEVGLFLGLEPGGFFDTLNMFVQEGRSENLELALAQVCEDFEWDVATAVLEVSKHFEDGAVKYGDRNWEKGIPLHCYIDSAVRHYLKWMRDDNDEPHDRAVLWNLFCALWTYKNLPEMNDLPNNKPTISPKKPEAGIPTRNIQQFCGTRHTIYNEMPYCTTCEHLIPAENQTEGNIGKCGLGSMEREISQFEATHGICNYWTKKEGGQ